MLVPLVQLATVAHQLPSPACSYQAAGRTQERVVGLLGTVIRFCNCGENALLPLPVHLVGLLLLCCVQEIQLRKAL